VFVTNHVLSGALIGRLLKDRPGAALLAGVASHLVLDAVPHWGCGAAEPGRSERNAPQVKASGRFLTVARRDGVLGLGAMAAAAAIVERPARTATVAAMTGAVLLDLDKPLFYFFGVNPFPTVVQRLHGWVQRESPHGLANELGFGFVCAVGDVLAVARARGHRIG
jgi:hypothetical protein